MGARRAGTGLIPPPPSFARSAAKLRYLPRQGGGDQLRGQRQPELRVEDDAHRIASTDDARGELRIIGEHRADTDENGVVRAAKNMGVLARCSR